MGITGGRSIAIEGSLEPGVIGRFVGLGVARDIGDGVIGARTGGGATG